MKRIIFSVAATMAYFITLPAEAQIYQWTDASGKKMISDKPPPGQVRQQKTYDAEALAQKDTKPPEEQKAQSEPKEKSLADRELEFRKRQKEQQEKEEKAKKEAAAAAEKKENCDNARRRLQTFESGQRIAMQNEKGERYYVEDAQRAQEIEKTRNILETNCK